MSDLLGRITLIRNSQRHLIHDNIIQSSLSINRRSTSEGKESNAKICIRIISKGGCNSEINLARNTAEIREVRLQPKYIGEYEGADLSVELFGEKYDAPFGIAPIGLQGLMWPKACELLAAAAHETKYPVLPIHCKYSEH